MSKITGNEPINAIVSPLSGNVSDCGLTIRQYFAALAMQGLLSNNDLLEMPYKDSEIEKYRECKNRGEFVATHAVDLADALIAQLNANQ